MSKAITKDQPERPGDRLGLGSPLPEVAPSRLREDEMGLPRTFGLAGAVLLIFGSMALAFHLSGRIGRINPGIALFLVALGLCGLLYHAAFDRDLVFRRLYLGFALALLLLGAVLSLLPYPRALGDQLRFAAPCLLLALFFFLAALRNEDDPGFRNLLQLIFGGAGALFAAVGLFGGNFQNFFTIGLVFALLGLLYLASFVSSRGISDDLAYYASLALVFAGLAIIVVSLVRALATANGADYFTASGVILVAVGLAYALTGGGLASDSTLLVLLRRELGAFFFSPITYLVLFGFGVAWFFTYWLFVDQLFQAEREGFAFPEPIVQSYLFSIVPVILLIITVPVMTMGLFSEENRSGTTEVLLTAPVSEGNVVLSKFLAAFLTYMLTWAPAGLYLLAIPLMGGNPFDYRPLLSFLLCMMVWSAAFVSMGIFFSSVTRNVLVAAVLSGAGMLLLTFVYFPPAFGLVEKPEVKAILTHMSYLDVWKSSLEGKIVPRYLVFPLSMTIFFLFLTNKVLESRKWR